MSKFKGCSQEIFLPTQESEKALENKAYFANPVIEISH